MSAGFDFRRRLGAGHFGEVWHATDLGLNTDCALKCIPPDKVINQDNFYQEAQTLKAAEHANIVKVAETGNLDDGRIYVVMEYLKNGSLEDEAQGGYIPLSRAKKLMIDVLRGLEHAHLKEIVHRDIKPANIMIGDNNEGKLSDFGLALPDISSLDLSTIKGYQYLLHLAPEVESFEEYTVLADVYSAGVTLYRLVNGDSYLPAVSPLEATQMAKAGKFPDRSYYRGFVPNSLKKLINKAIEVDPDDRFQSAEEMRRALEKIELRFDWEEEVVANGKKWAASSRDEAVEISRLRSSDGTWAIEVKKGRRGKNLRRTRELCRDNLSEKTAIREAYRLLQKISRGSA